MEILIIALFVIVAALATVIATRSLRKAQQDMRLIIEQTVTALNVDGLVSDLLTRIVQLEDKLAFLAFMLEHATEFDELKTKHNALWSQYHALSDRNLELADQLASLRRAQS